MRAMYTWPVGQTARHFGQRERGLKMIKKKQKNTKLKKKDKPRDERSRRWLVVYGLQNAVECGLCVCVCDGLSARPCEQVRVLNFTVDLILTCTIAPLRAGAERGDRGD